MKALDNPTVDDGCDLEDKSHVLLMHYLILYLKAGVRPITCLSRVYSLAALNRSCLFVDVSCLQQQQKCIFFLDFGPDAS